MKNFYTFQNLSQQTQCHHLVTKKEKSEPYSFSLALHTQEDPQQIVQNRKQFSKYFSNSKFIVAKQTHSANIHIVKEAKELGWNTLDDAIENCDALITNQKDVMLTILTADCVPILLFDPIEKVVAAVHAGWKGTEQKILFKTVKKMKEVFNSKPENILAGIAPSIGKCCYEVDWNVAQYFKDIENAYDKKEEKYMLDLPYINKKQLLDAGVQEKNIEISHICTACEVEHYFSYRKENGCSGRFMSMIGLN
jgi:YfiH family protein